jgi:hypothetical protein
MVHNPSLDDIHSLARRGRLDELLVSEAKVTNHQCTMLAVAPNNGIVAQTPSGYFCPWCEIARLMHDIEAGSAEIAKLHNLMCRVLEWEPALPAESGLLDELASAVKGRVVEPSLAERETAIRQIPSARGDIAASGPRNGLTAEPAADPRDVIKVWECDDCKAVNFDVTSTRCKSCLRPRAALNRTPST